MNLLLAVCLIVLLALLAYLVQKSLHSTLPNSQGRGEGSVSTTRDWPTSVPRLYETESGPELSTIMTSHEAMRVRKLPRVMVFPFLDRSHSPDENAVGAALARLIIRNLMLDPGMSVRGPEDVPLTPLDEFDMQAPPRLVAAHMRIGGTVELTGQGLAVRLEARDHSQTRTVALAAPTLEEVIERIMNGLPGLLGLERPLNSAARRVVVPDARAFTKYGHLVLMDDSDEQRTHRALKLWREHPEFSLLLHLLDDDILDPLSPYLDGFQHDPCDAQLAFLLFCRLWDSEGYQPAALQYARRAIELSPGHGKAHMVATHAAHPAANMLHHAELGYQLLPGNAFAITNYVQKLKRHHAPPDRIAEIALEGVYWDPEDPSNYEQLISIHKARREYRRALLIARQLQGIYDAMSPRTRYCLEQDPQQRERLRRGLWDPAAENRALIWSLERLVRP